MDDSNPRAVIGANLPPPHAEFIQQAADLKEEAKAWLDGMEITSQAEAEKVAMLADLGTKLVKASDTARMAITKPLDDMKAGVMDDFRPVGVTVELIKAAAKKATTKWLIKVAADKAEAERIERERLAAEQARLLEANKEAASLEAIEATQEAITGLMADQKALQRSEKTTVKVATGSVRSMALRTVWNIEVTDWQALAKWFMANKTDILKDWLFDMALKHVRACSGNAVIAGVKVIADKEAV